ncbi:hypothetical protein [Mucilaginibacter celer]|uniref:Uncharacterized protein n=1 Tax=Mucilaginibacter celer TaxID=2305508 RepID=A0A494VQK6_9SPHI|nr:hypothetical protein [Mucilaginibacter celer]AYL96251.1 hypothetical protein HYN43_013530 [Mucilaginibacter celer]
MKKLLFLVACTICGVNLYGQSITFDNLHHLLKEKNPDYLINKPFLFVKDERPYPIPRFIKNAHALNEEVIDYNAKGATYQSRNKAYITTLIKQIKYPLILKDSNGPSVFYQYGNTHVTIMIDVYKATDKGGNITITEK